LFYCNFKVAPLFLFLISAPFLVKLPIYFLHYWLPKAHVESPTLGSMVLASLILKMGGYGLVVFFLKLGGGVNRVVIFVLVWGGLFCGIVTILQIDIKSFIAYLSIIHITSLRLILMSGGRGKVIISGMSIMLIHGMGAPALFFFSGRIYYFFKSRVIVGVVGSLENKIFGFSVLSLVLINIGVPFFPGIYPELLFFWVCFFKSLGVVFFFVFMLGAVILIKFILIISGGKVKLI